MRATNTIVPQGKKDKPTFSAAITGDALQNLIKKSVPDAKSAARLTGALISAVAASPQLQNCKPATVVAAALKGEGQGLTIGREYYLIPYGDNCGYVISYKGLIALCLAGNDVADIDAIEVREGEIVGRDPRTKRLKFDFSVYPNDEEAAKHPVIGYYAYVETAGGYFRYEYMTVGEIIQHADRYSSAFDRAKYDRFVSGDCTPQEVEKLMHSSPWYSATDVMMKKTVMRRLLNSGYVRLANSAAINEALSNDADDNLIPDLGLGASDDEPEIVSTQDAPTDAQDTMQESESTGNTTEPEKPRQRRSNAKETAKNDAPAPQAVVATEADAMESFFSDGDEGVQE